MINIAFNRQVLKIMTPTHNHHHRNQSEKDIYPDQPEASTHIEIGAVHLFHVPSFFISLIQYQFASPHGAVCYPKVLTYGKTNAHGLNGFRRRYRKRPHRK